MASAVAVPYAVLLSVAVWLMTVLALLMAVMAASKVVMADCSLVSAVVLLALAVTCAASDFFRAAVAPVARLVAVVIGS